jgi:hypothetical protein
MNDDGEKEMPVTSISVYFAVYILVYIKNCLFTNIFVYFTVYYITVSIMYK